jgi:hypothetical protein
MRATIVGGPEGLEIVIPARRTLFTLVIVVVWLIGWFMGEANVLAGLSLDEAEARMIVERMRQRYASHGTPAAMGSPDLAS